MSNLPGCGGSQSSLRFPIPSCFGKWLNWSSSCVSNKVRVDIPVPGPGETLPKVTTTTICGTDVHILHGDYPVAPVRIVGHEPVGLSDEQVLMCPDIMSTGFGAPKAVASASATW